MAEAKGTNFVTRDEFLKAFQHFETQVSTSLSALSDKIDSISERRGNSARQIWLGVAAIFVTITLAGAALVGFAVSGAVQPVIVTQQILAGNQVRDHEALESAGRDLAKLKGRYEVIEGLVLHDVRIEHGGGAGAALNQAKIDQMGQRQSELWQLLETLDLKIQRLDRVTVKEEN